MPTTTTFSSLASRLARRPKPFTRATISSLSSAIPNHNHSPEPQEDNPSFLSSPRSLADAEARFLLFPETRVSELANDLRVVTQSSLAIRTAAVGVWIDAGSRFETPETNGIAHFLEHMIFKGTRRRTARGLEEEIENAGARLNAYTSREHTTYYANVLRGDVSLAVDVLADILQNSRFHDSAITRERSVILREMEEVQGQIEEVFFDYLHMAAFQNSPLGNTILGPAENIQTISKFDLHEYITTHYTGHRMVVSAAGAVRHEDMVDEVSKLFTRLSNDSTTASMLVEENPAVFTGSEADQLCNLSSTIMEEFSRIAHEVSEDEVIRAKNQMLTYGRSLPFLELFSRVDAVDVGTVKQTAMQLIVDKDIAIAGIGPIHQLPDHSWFRSQTC